jgi:hypothetical protein
MPSVWKAPKIGFAEIAIAGGGIALLFLAFVRTLNQASLVPLNDPILAFERLHGTFHRKPEQRKLRGVEQ